MLFNQAKKFGDLSKGAGKYLKFTKGLGFSSGIYGIYDTYGNYSNNPSLYNEVKLGLNALSLVNPRVGLGLGIMDAKGATDWILTTTIGK